MPILSFRCARLGGARGETGGPGQTSSENLDIIRVIFWRFELYSGVLIFVLLLAMEHYADAQMRTPNQHRRSRVRRARSFGEINIPRTDSNAEQLLKLNRQDTNTIDNKHSRNEPPHMSVDQSRMYAQTWIKQREEKQQVLWVEVTRPKYWIPPKGKRCDAAKRQCSWLFLKLFPFFVWIRNITKNSFVKDAIAGITVGVMLIPQSMSYAQIAGLQYKYGLYAGLVPIFVYAFTGTSRQLAVGPVALVSLIVEALLRGQLTEDECPLPSTNPNDPNYLEGYKVGDQQWSYCPDQYAQLAFLACFIAGVFQIAASFLQLGFIVSFLAHPVVSGFTSGAAITIGLSQVQYFVGYKIAKSPYIYQTFQNIFDPISQFDWVTFVCGVSFWLLLWGARQLSQKKKEKFGWLRPCMPLITCGLGIIIAGNVPHFGGCGFQVCNTTEAEYAVKTRVVGDFPGGFPPFSASVFDFSKVGRVLPTAISASLIGFMESIAIAKSLATKHKYEVDPGQELFALGLSNLVGSMFSSYIVTGSFSRSAVSNNTGAVTNLAGLITSLVMLLTLLVLVPAKVFFFLPLFVLAAIVISSVTNLVDIAEARYLWRVKKSDFCLWVLAFLGTLFLGVQDALLLSVGVSILVVIYESVRPQMVVLWRLPGTPIYRNVKQDSVGVFVPGVLIVRIGASMYFANVAFIRDKLKDLVFNFYNLKSQHDDDNGDGEEASRDAATAGEVSSRKTTSDANDSPKTEIISSSDEKYRSIRYIIIECTAVISLDSTAIHMLEGLTREFKERGVRVAFACVGSRMHKDLKRAGLESKIGPRWFHHSVHSAVCFCMEHRNLTCGLRSTDSDTESSDDQQLDGSLHFQTEVDSEQVGAGEAYGTETVEQV